MTDNLTLKVRVSGKDGWQGDITLSKDADVKELRQQVAEKLSIPPSSIRLLCKRFLKDGKTLASYKLRNKAKVVAMPTATKEEKQELVQVDTRITKTEMMIQAATEMAERTEQGKDRDFYFEVEDQEGNLVSIAESDRKALVLGMALHEKAKALIKNKEYFSALTLLQKADKEGFAKCDKKYLQAVDNYGFLCLDLVWVYLKIKDESFISDANERLNQAEKCLQRSHGKDLERLLQLKNGSCPELVLYVRLHLLRGILAYHTGNMALAKQYLAQVQAELAILDISDEELISLVSLDTSFTTSKARIALRACNKDINRAYQYLINKKQKASLQKERRKRQRAVGKTINSNWVDLKMLDDLISKGFYDKIAAEALRQTDNNLEKSISLLQHSADTLMAAVSKNVTMTEKMISEITQYGYTRSQARATLSLVNCDVKVALELLASGNGADEEEAEEEEGEDITMSDGEQVKKEGDEEDEEDVATKQELSEEELLKQQEEEKKRKAEEEERKRIRQAKLEREEELANDISADRESYLDYTLHEEAELLAHYYALTFV